MKHMNRKTQLSAKSFDGLFGTLLTDSLTAFGLTRVLALSFLPHLGVSAFLLSLFTDPVAQINVPINKFGFAGDGC